MSAADSLRAEAAKRILIKDGAYGTQVQAERLPEEGYAGALGLGKDQRGNGTAAATVTATLASEGSITRRG